MINFDAALISSMKTGSTWLASNLAAIESINVVHGQAIIYDRFGIYHKANKKIKTGYNILRRNLIQEDDFLLSLYASNRRLKIISMIRNPVLRAYSHYKHKVRKYHYLNIAGRLALDGINTKNSGFFGRTYDFNYDVIEAINAGLPYPDFLSKSFYYENLKKYIDLFGLDNILIYDIEQASLDVNSFLSIVIRHLGIDESITKFQFDENVVNEESFKSHESYLPWWKIRFSTISDETIRSLDRLFIDDVYKLDSAFDSSYSELWGLGRT